ncbi:MAG: phenylalanine--tRNA ligase subunit alpha [Zestosphaera sp.]
MTENIVLPPRQYRLIQCLATSEEALTVTKVGNMLGLRESDLMRDLAELESKSLVRLERRVSYSIKLSNLGLKYLEEGLPEERLLKHLQMRGGSAPLEDLRKLGLNEDEVKAALGQLRKHRLVKLEKGLITLVNGGVESLSSESLQIKELMRRHVKPVIYEEVPKWVVLLKHRRIVEVDEVREIKVHPTQNLLRLLSEGKIIEGHLITNLTSEMLMSGSWRTAIIKEFDLGVDVPKRTPRLRHPYTQFMMYIKEILIGMGFEEVKGPYLESSLWNFDALFVPQHHPARKESDVYYVENVELPVSEKDVLERTKKVHEEVLRYNWRSEVAATPVLRTHTTPVSMRTIYERGAGEYRVFSFDRVFRPDTPDPTHLMEFHQLEGIIVGKEVTFRELLGFFKELASRLGMKEVRFKPAYFPFTEPSVEGFVRHPKLGWVEVFPGGMFRPEVLASVALPTTYKVAAWGIGIDRLAMIVLGVDDIRDLYSNDLDVIEATKIPEVMLRNA